MFVHYLQMLTTATMLSASPNADTALLALGRNSYRVTQVTDMETSIGRTDNSRYVRDLSFSMEVADAGNGQYSVKMLVDSMAETVGSKARAPLPGFTGAVWKGIVQRSGRRVSAGLMTADGKETQAHFVTTLAWILPALLGGTTDTLVVDIASMNAVKRRWTTVRNFTRTDGKPIEMKGTMVGEILSAPVSGGKPVKVTSTGTTDGNWNVSSAGVIESAVVNLRTHDDFLVGANTATRDDFSVITLTRLNTSDAEQKHPLVGKWEVQLPPTKVMKDGASVPVTPKGELTFVIEKDSLIGTLKTLVGEGFPPQPTIRLSAKAVPGKVTFISRREARLVGTSDEMTRTAVIQYDFEATDDVLKGSIERSIEGLGIQMGGAQPVTGKRVPG